jgi:tetratricopeptide (TPR) repeat protein
LRNISIVALLVVFLFGCAGGRSAPASLDPRVPAAKALTEGIELYRAGCYDRSLGFLLRAHELYTAADDRAGAATALNNIGNIHRARKDIGRSLLYYDAAAELFTEISDEQGRTRALINRASALIEDGRLAEAESVLAAARSGANEGPAEANWLLTHGVLLFRKGSADSAEAEMRLALDRAGGEAPEAVSGIHFALARLLRETGRAEEAVKHAEDALAADRNTGAYRKTADDLSLLGDALLRADNAPAAAAAFRRAMRIYALLGDTGAVSESARQMKATGIESVHPLTLEFVERWLKGDVRSRICR